MYAPPWFLSRLGWLGRRTLREDADEVSAVIATLAGPARLTYQPPLRGRNTTHLVRLDFLVPGLASRRTDWLVPRSGVAVGYALTHGDALEWLDRRLRAVRYGSELVHPSPWPARLAALLYAAAGFVIGGLLYVLVKRD